MGYNLSPKVLIKLQNQLRQLSDNRDNEVSWTLENEKEAKNFHHLLRSALRQIELNDTGPYKGIYGKTVQEGVCVKFIPKRKVAAKFVGGTNDIQISEVSTFTDLFLRTIPTEFISLVFPNLGIKENEVEMFNEWIKMKGFIQLSSNPYTFTKSS